MIEKLKGEILSKITDEAIEDGETISDLKPYKDILKCSTLGRYLAIQLIQNIPSFQKEEKIKWKSIIGEKTNDFEGHKNNSDFKNLIREYIPHKIVQAV